jgi:hypothetical protein
MLGKTDVSNPVSSFLSELTAECTAAKVYVRVARTVDRRRRQAAPVGAHIPFIRGRPVANDVALFDDLLVTLPLTLGCMAVLYVVANTYFKQSFRREIRLNAIETIIKQLGIKDFHPKDLNTDKLDDKGYARLLGLINVLYATQSGNQYGTNRALQEAQNVINQLGQWGQLPQQQPQPPQGPGINP